MEEVVYRGGCCTHRFIFGNDSVEEEKYSFLVIENKYRQCIFKSLVFCFSKRLADAGLLQASVLLHH